MYHVPIPTSANISIDYGHIIPFFILNPEDEDLFGCKSSFVLANEAFKDHFCFMFR